MVWHSSKVLPCPFPITPELLVIESWSSGFKWVAKLLLVLLQLRGAMCNSKVCHSLFPFILNVICCSNDIKIVYFILVRFVSGLVVLKAETAFSVLFGQKIVCDFTKILWVRLRDHQEFRSWVSSRKIFLKFFHFHLKLEDPQKFSMFDFSNFLVRNVKSSFTGSWQIPKGK